MIHDCMKIIALRVRCNKIVWQKHFCKNQRDTELADTLKVETHIVKCKMHLFFFKLA